MEANSPKRSRRQEIIKLRGEINQVETRRTIQRINQIRSWFFEKINKIYKPLVKLKGKETVSKFTKSKMKQERAYTSSLTAYLEALELKEANSPKRSRQQEIIKLGAEINQVEIKRTI